MIPSAHGPFAPTQMKELARTGKIDKETKVRLGADGKWISGANVKGLFDIEKVDGVAPVLRKSEDVTRSYGGIKRLPYLAIMLGFGIVYVLIFAIARINSGNPTALVWVFHFASIVPADYRLKNIGMSRWWLLLLFVPGLNLIVLIHCLICQEGYNETKKLDKIGKAVVYVFIGIGLAFPLFAAYIVMTGI